jgi:hypothetical protein
VNEPYKYIIGYELGNKFAVLSVVSTLSSIYISVCSFFVDVWSGDVAQPQTLTASDDETKQASFHLPPTHTTTMPRSDPYIGISDLTEPLGRIEIRLESPFLMRARANASNNIE